jgi:hypothetical protein
MWTPAINRERRIALQDRSTRFFGTDFSFEDLEERDTDQYDYKLLAEESLDGAPCWKIQGTPEADQGFTVQSFVPWVRKDNYALAKIETTTRLNSCGGPIIRKSGMFRASDRASDRYA